MPVHGIGQSSGTAGGGGMGVSIGEEGVVLYFPLSKEKYNFFNGGHVNVRQPKGPQRGWLVTPKGFIEYYKAMRKCLE